MKYFYIYKITLTQGSLKDSYYFGQHKTNNLNDGYKGSGAIVRKYYKKYPDGYIKEIIAYYNSQDELDKAEFDIIEPHLNDDKCLNICYGGKSGGGHPQTEETKQKISNTVKGRKPNNYGHKWTDEQRRNHSEKMKGRTTKLKGISLSEEHKQNISNSLKGIEFSEEHKQNLRKPKKEKRTEEHRKHLSESLKGRKSPNEGKNLSEEHRKHLSESHKGKSSPNKGKKMSEEQKQKLREAWVRRKQKRLTNFLS